MSALHANPRRNSAVFAALGDKTRLSLVAKLCVGPPRSISGLTKGTRLSRQAITRHLRVLERVKMVRSVRAGRESLFEFDPKPLQDARQYLDLVSRQWDESLARLKAFIEAE